MKIEETSRGFQTTLTLNIPRGLHARPSAKLAQLARKYKSDILLRSDGGEVDAKSMLDILSLSCPVHARLELLAKGEDAQDALKELTSFLTTPEDFNGPTDS